MKGAIIYKGKYGATRQYAEWLAEELQLPVHRADDINGDQLMGYNFLLIGTSVYIGKLQIQHWLKNNLAVLQGKKIFLFQVAGTPPNEKEKLETYIRLGIPGEISNQCEVYFLHGKMKMKELSWKDRFMLKIGAILTKDPIEKKAMLTDHDHVKKENIIPLLNAVRKSFVATDLPIPAPQPLKPEE